MKYSRTLFVLLDLLSIVLLTCQDNQVKTMETRSGTALMADTLQAIAEKIDPLKDYYMNSRRVKYFENQMGAATPREKGRLMYQLFKELINGGKNKEAITSVNSFIQQLNLDIDQMDKNSKLIFELLALAHLRDGELKIARLIIRLNPVFSL